MTHPDDMPEPPDGPTPAREQLPLPRRRRQSHIEPQLRTPDGTSTGTPFAAFGPDGAPELARSASSDCYERGGYERGGYERGGHERGGQTDRAAAFHAGAHRGRCGHHRADR
ncbi:hypothetical protein K1T35_22590 [Pseudonocardia sp. DSM 110487]|uniref:hypothetical protein n=1 Tax=Pseudonocardia sp. DSM 110487 TaxID=2865833 RepID=UPI001C695B8C|nr:hypothetical protein [Pseudonocardia sp. DSM 110487]QYN39736.1 hypothetical protein K1T35_22590 [Pseudonocardia sp. DSM 110487]